MAQGLAYFPGIERLVQASYALSHGITPGGAVLTIAPQESYPAAGGALEFQFGGVQLEFPDCKIDSASIEVNDRSQIIQLRVIDRRWKWAYGGISGSYNRRQDDNQIDKDTEKTPQELAALCLEAMGEQRFDVSQLPNVARPEIEWVRDNPAQALANLVEVLGCRVVLGVDNSVRICTSGVGRDLPLGDDVQNASVTIDPPERPDKTVITCGISRYQVDFQLEAVGLDTDGVYKPLKFLSYAPDPNAEDGGFRGVDAPYFHDLADANARKSASESVFLTYRVDRQLARLSGIPGYEGAFDDFTTILPIESEMVETVTESGVERNARNRPAIVYGVYYDPQRNDNLKNTAEELRSITDYESTLAKQTVFPDEFTIDRQRAIVRFVHPVFRYVKTDDNDGYLTAPALLVLRTAVSIRDPATRAWTRYERERPCGGQTFGTPPRYVRHDELVRTFVPTYDDSFNVQSIDDNKTKVDQECDRYLDSIDQEYTTPAPQSVTYAGLKKIDLDGAIGTVAWSVGPSGASTQAHRNSDSSAYGQSYQERRVAEKLRAVPEQLAEIKKARP